jgi:hypothetical protein
MELDLGTNEVAASELVRGVVRLADPHAVAGLDVAIPGTRSDLAKRWIQARLTGRAKTRADLLALAAQPPLPRRPSDGHSSDGFARCVFKGSGDGSDWVDVLSCRNGQPDPALRPGPDGTWEAPVLERVEQTRSARAFEQVQLLAYAEDVRRRYARELERSRELERTCLATVRALAAAVEAKDDYTGGHIQRVHGLALLLARAVVPDEVGDVQMSYGFLLHDIGKLAVPDGVLTKAGPLTDDEWTLMRAHPQAGVRILSEVPFLDRALDVVLHHHERWDGTGYPHGLRGEDIPLWARIFSVVDTVDAMTSERPYRQALPMEVTLGELHRHAGAQFDPVCVEAFAGLDPATLEPWRQGGASSEPAPGARRLGSAADRPSE